MTAKEYLFDKGVTNDPAKGLYVKRDDMEFDVAEMMEDFVSIARNKVKTTNINVTPYEQKHQTGWIWNSTYYPLTGPVPRVMGRIPAVQTVNGPHPVKETDYLVHNVKGEVLQVISQELFLRDYNT